MDSTTRIFILSWSYHLVLLVQKRPSCRFGLRISYPLFKSSVNQIQELSLNWFWLSPLCVSYSLRIRWWLLISEWFCFFLLAQLPVAISLVCTNVRASEKKVKKKSWVASASQREGETCVCQKKKRRRRFPDRNASVLLIYLYQGWKPSRPSSSSSSLLCSNIDFHPLVPPSSSR